MLVRDKNYIASQLTQKENAIYTKQKTIIEFPKWYQDKGLYDNSDKTFVYGVFAIIIGDRYSVSVIPTVMATEPIAVMEIERDGVEYFQLVYGKDDCLFEDTKILKQPFLSYNFFDGYYFQAKIPWFIEYNEKNNDLVKILDNMVRYGGSKLGANLISNEVVTSFIARNPKDKTQFFRLDPKGDPSFVDLMDVRFSALNTLNKLAGNYFEDALTGALVQKEKSPTTLENLVRK